MRKYTAKQKKWCKFYQETTGFEPLMGEFEAGTESFEKAAQGSIDWFEAWSSDALLELIGSTRNFEGIK